MPCEIIVKRVLPALRAMIARELVGKYGFAQAQVANILGVTQASVSHYLSAKRGKIAEGICEPEELKHTASEIASKIAKGVLKREDLPKLFCNFCSRLKRKLGLQ